MAGCKGQSIVDLHCTNLHNPSTVLLSAWLQLNMGYKNIICSLQKQNWRSTHIQFQIKRPTLALAPGLHPLPIVIIWLTLLIWRSSQSQSLSRSHLVSFCFSKSCPSACLTLWWSLLGFVQDTFITKIEDFVPSEVFSWTNPYVREGEKFGIDKGIKYSKLWNLGQETFLLLVSNQQNGLEYFYPED